MPASAARWCSRDSGPVSCRHGEPPISVCSIARLTRRAVAVVERHRAGAQLVVERGDAAQHLRHRRAAAVLGHQPRIVDVAEDAERAAGDHQAHQRIGERVDVPAEMEAGVQRRDDEQREAEIDMRREPRLELALIARIGALAVAEPHQPQDQQRADGAEHIAGPGAAVAARRAARSTMIEDDRRQRPPRRRS